MTRTKIIQDNNLTIIFRDGKISSIGKNLSVALQNEQYLKEDTVYEQEETSNNGILQ